MSNWMELWTCIVTSKPENGFLFHQGFVMDFSKWFYFILFLSFLGHVMCWNIWTKVGEFGTVIKGSLENRS